MVYRPNMMAGWMRVHRPPRLEPANRAPMSLLTIVARRCRCTARVERTASKYLPLKAAQRMPLDLPRKTTAQVSYEFPFLKAERKDEKLFPFLAVWRTRSAGKNGKFADCLHPTMEKREQ